MITLTVISFNGRPIEPALSASFDELGGTIGRADTNQLVLPDPERSVSRVHARVSFRNGQYAVVDQGSNPVSVNGRPLGQGKEAPLAAGDQVQIGGYLIEARVGVKAPAGAAADPFADLFGPSTPSAASAAAGLFDPLVGFAASPATPAPRAPASAAPFDPFAALGSGPAPAAGLPGSARGSAPPAKPGIPDDWDPFAPPASSAARPGAAAAFGAPAHGARDLGLDLGAAAPMPLLPDMAGNGAADNASLDSLFGLSAGPAGDPLARSALDAPIALPNMAAAANPLQSLNSAARGSAAPVRDQLSDLQRPFDARISPVAPAAVPVPTPVASRPAPSKAVLSWSDGPTPGANAPADPFRPADRPTAATAIGPDAMTEIRPSRPMPATASVPVPAPHPGPIPAVSASQRGAAATAEATDALLKAFREGLAAPTVQVEALTPELMRLIGELLREAASGTVDLLIARAALKREVRAEATMIVARENNPLKFSPSAEAALGHLLSPPTRGFMPAGPAMRDAYDDLRAHQIGFLAGMRAALEGLLENFDPARLEGRLDRASGLKSLLPGNKQARSWDIFTQRYAELRAEAQDDFHSLFGKAFLQAYEQHIDQLKSGSR